MEKQRASTLLSPKDLYAKATHYDVSLADEPFLIPLMKQAAVTPLPPNWIKVAGDQSPQEEEEDQACSYKNELTGEVHERHPADIYFRQQIEMLRAQHAQIEFDGAADQRLHTSFDATNGWMEFEELCGSADDAETEGEGGRTKKYYYDFVSEIRQDMHPLVKLRDAAHCGASAIASPQLFDHATTLHKQTTMKK